jgi:hypothetical protein
MRGFISVITLLAASATIASAGAQGNPHAKAAKHAKRSVAPVATKDAPRTRSTSMYLNENTASKLMSALGNCKLTPYKSSRSMAVRCLTSTLISVNHTQEPSQ